MEVAELKAIVHKRVTEVAMRSMSAGTCMHRQLAKAQWR
jgi:hypothetical protein